MSQQFDRKIVCPGVWFNAVTDARYKTNRLSLNLIIPLDRQTATAQALIPFLMRKGIRSCPDYTKFNELLNSLYGAFLDADVRKIADSHMLTIAISGIADRFALKQEPVLHQCIDILCQMLFSPAFLLPSFSDESFAIEQKALIDTIEAEINDKRTYAVSRMEEVMFANEPTGVKNYGYKQAAQALTMQQAIDAYYQMLKTAHIEIMFVGSQGATEAFEVLHTAFVDHAVNTPYKLAPIVKTTVDTVKSQTDTMDVAQSKLVMGFRTGVDPFDDNYAMRLAIALYGGTPNSKLFLNVREKLSLCYYCAARFQRTKGVMTVDSGVEQANIEQAETEILAQLQAMQQGDFTQQQLDDAKLSVINGLKSVSDSPASTEQWYLMQVLLGKQNTPQQECQGIQEVTKQQVVDAANTIVLDTVYLLTSQQGGQTRG